MELVYSYRNIPDSPIGEEGSVPRERVRHLSMEFILWESTVQLVSVPRRCSENGFHFVGILFSTVQLIYCTATPALPIIITKTADSTARGGVGDWRHAPLR